MRRWSSGLGGAWEPSSSSMPPSWWEPPSLKKPPSVLGAAVVPTDVEVESAAAGAVLDAGAEASGGAVESLVAAGGSRASSRSSRRPWSRRESRCRRCRRPRCVHSPRTTLRRPTRRPPRRRRRSGGSSVHQPLRHPHHRNIRTCSPPSRAGSNGAGYARVATTYPDVPPNRALNIHAASSAAHRARGQRRARSFHAASAGAVQFRDQVLRFTSRRGWRPRRGTSWPRCAGRGRATSCRRSTGRAACTRRTSCPTVPRPATCR